MKRTYGYAAVTEDEGQRRLWSFYEAVRERFLGMDAAGGEDRRPRLVVLTGPTGVGKTDLAIRLVEYFGGEIISADSMQVYRHLDIGTAKPPRSVREAIPHHLIDVVDPDESFSVASFVESAGRIIAGLHREKKTIWVIGGTGLYIRALLGGLASVSGADSHIRNRLKREMRERGLSHLYEKLRRVDPGSAERIHENDAFRIIRALEVFESSGRTMTERQREHGFREQPYRALRIGLAREREDLFSRIDRRVEEMLRQGLVEETEGLIRRGYDESLKPLQTLTYRPVFRYLRGEDDLPGLMGTLRRETRLYARRQETWFKKEKGIEWFHPGDGKDLRDRMAAFLEQGAS